MRVLLAFDKFKDCLTASAACAIAAAAIRQTRPDAEIDVCPTADGGDGFAEILTQAAKGELYAVSVHDPIGRPVVASLGLVAAGDIPLAARLRLNVQDGARVAVIEMAAASGLALLSPNERDVWQTSSYGTGELLAAAATAGADAIVLGVGGSATSDLGLGALHALGFQLCDRAGEPVDAAPAGWANAVAIRGRVRELPPLYIACDVTNPLMGPTGAAAVYGPQKGLATSDVARFDAEAQRLATLLCEWSGQSRSLQHERGAGAAGGITFGLRAAYGATLLPGCDFVSEWLDLPKRIAAADIVITGEGRFDASSLHGKGPAEIIARALRARKEVHVFAGALTATPPAPAGAHAITPAGMPLDVARRQANELLAAAILRVFASAKAAT